MSRAKTEAEKALAHLLGGRLRTARKAAGLTQDHLGKLLGDPGNQSVSHYELGKQTPTLSRLVDLAQLLRTSTDWLLGFAPLSELSHAGVQEEPLPFAHQQTHLPTREDWQALFDTTNEAELRSAYACVLDLKPLGARP